ncbi:hypothetical protein ACLOJK_021758 [Asimina triloba]
MMRRSRSQSEGSAREEEEVQWEMRPGGMLVQKRNGKSDIPMPDFRLRIAYGAMRYDISVNSQATFAVRWVDSALIARLVFDWYATCTVSTKQEGRQAQLRSSVFAGDLKKLVCAETGLEPKEQRLIFRGKERENGEYLDMCGVKDRSKVVLVEDPSSREKRFLEMRRNAKIQSAYRAISDVSTEVDKLADQVSVIEKSVTNRNKVAEVQISTLIEMLMLQAIKLDGISAEGEASTQKNLQGPEVRGDAGYAEGYNCQNEAGSGCDDKMGDIRAANLNPMGIF